MNFIVVNRDNITHVHKFLKTTTSKHFRYYEKRTPEDSINNHVYTIVGYFDNEIVSYGHIDKLYDRYWLGICVSDNKINNKYGTKTLIQLLDWCSKNINIVYLSVDIDNVIAIEFYKKYGFILDTTYEKNNTIFMKKITSVYNTMKLDVSYGEALDKLSILEIKLENINDERKIDVQIEYDVLSQQIKHINNNDINYFYNLLKSINSNIWVLQDKYRISNDINEKNFLCNDILNENDRRFKVKSKINNYLNSSLKEQKGYAKTKAFLLTHLGLGDIINCIGMIRYLSTNYDKVVVVCKNAYYKNVKMLFENDNTIQFYLCNDDKDISPSKGFNLNKFQDIVKGHDVFLCGVHQITDKVEISMLPFTFYENIGLNPLIYREYSYIPRIIESKQLYNSVININTNYIIVHQSSSLGNLFQLEQFIGSIDINNILVINVDKNIYTKEHKFYNIAEKCVMKPLLYYVDLIENSIMNLLSDSCLFCLALQLNIKTKNNLFVGRSTYEYLFDPKYGFDPKKHPKFNIVDKVQVM